MAGAWVGDELLGLAFNHSDPQAALAALATSSAHDQHLILTSPTMDDEPTVGQADLVVRLQAFAEGQGDDFLDARLDESRLTPFQRRVVHYCRRIPAGKVATYGQLAQQAGSPGAARAVGQVMASNRWPLIVPCHRVIGAGGGLGGYSAPDGLAVKRKLLAREGVIFP
jgi:methylated-DNA-[protein]-cysteine S-methyltransferase